MIELISRNCTQYFLKRTLKWAIGIGLVGFVILVGPGCKKDSSKVVDQPTSVPALPHIKAHKAKRKTLSLKVPHYSTHSSVADAFTTLLKKYHPQIIGIGEVHQKNATKKIPSALHRFNRDIVALLAKEYQHVIFETWMTYGTCGKVEKRVVKKVEKTIDRPQQTESELVKTIKHVKKLKMKPHILKLHCKDYQQIYQKKEIDYDALLKTITTHLQSKAEELLKSDSNTSALVLYGGALHNDLYPDKDLSMFSYAKALSKKVGGRFLEVDFYVPEYIEKDKSLSKYPWSVFIERATTKEVVLIERGPKSYILILKRTP